MEVYINWVKKDCVSSAWEKGITNGSLKAITTPGHTRSILFIIYAADFKMVAKKSMLAWPYNYGITIKLHKQESLIHEEMIGLVYISEVLKGWL